ncbi:MAG: CoA-binding protein [Thermodesulfobacteriota bacterium]
MECFFNPDGVAVIGASDSAGKGGYNIVHNIKNTYRGRVYPVNSRYTAVQGLPCYPSARDLPEKIDLAIVFVPAPAIPTVIEDCAAAGVRGVIIQSAGFAEVGPEGQALQEKVLATAGAHGIRLWGPNCIGLVDVAGRQVFSFVSPDIIGQGMVPGRVSMIVQSGMLSGGFLLDMMSGDSMGFARVCSIGNKMDVNECDILEYLIDDPDTGVIGCYLETLVDGRRFVELCRRTDKPVVVIKGGRTEHGARAAKSHTAGMAADAAVVSGILAQAGVIEAADFKQMADICNALALTGACPGKEEGRVAILTYSGGAGIISTDLMAGRRLRLAELRAETKEKMAPVFPDWMPVNNPVDFWPAVEKSGAVKTYLTCFQAVLEDPDVDVVFMHLFTGSRLKLDFGSLAEASRKANKPLFCWVIGHQQARREIRDALQQEGVPVFRELDRAMLCIDALFAHQRFVKRRIARRAG